MANLSDFVDLAGWKARPYLRTYDTKLSAEESIAYRQWKSIHAPFEPEDIYDYRGAFKAGVLPNDRGLWPDTFTKPSHPQFSTDSQYAMYGSPGIWNGDKYTPGKKSMMDYVPEQEVSDGNQETEPIRKDGGTESS